MIAPQIESRPPMTAPASARSANFVMANGVRPPKAGPSSAAARPGERARRDPDEAVDAVDRTPSRRATVGIARWWRRTASPNFVREKKR